MQCIVKKTALDEVLKAVQIIPYSFLKTSEDADTIGGHNIYEFLKVFGQSKRLTLGEISQNRIYA
jgi:hypothetical protein